jgi:hypothetical protein
MGLGKQSGPVRWAKRLSAVVIPLGILTSACGNSNDEGAVNGKGGTAGTAGTGGTSGTGGTAGSDSQECVAFHKASSLFAACEFVIPDCPMTLDEFLTRVTADGRFSYSFVEADGLRELRNVYQFGGHALSFDEDGMLAGWEAWIDSSFGPCGLPGYRQGRLLGETYATPADVHRCALARDALETGELCDCPCPDPPPENGIYESDACLWIPNWSHCAATFDEQRYTASTTTNGGSVRAGCGVRTITLSLSPIDCAYDETGALLGAERHRGEDLRNECPGVEAYRSGAAPMDCDDETVCWLGNSPPPGSDPCP